MASKKTLNAANLEALGAARLAELILDVTKGNAAAKRRLRLELAGEVGSVELVREIRRRLRTIARSQAFVDWRKIKGLVFDLNAQLQSIVGPVAKDDPASAFDLAWDFLGLANGIYERCDDGSGHVQAVFHDASDALADLAAAARPDPVTLADKLFAALSGDHYGHYPPLIRSLADVLGETGLAYLKSRLQEEGNATLDDYGLKTALQAMADATGDVDAYIIEQSVHTRSMPAIAAEMAARLLQAGRAEEALAAIDAADLSQRSWVPLEWEVTRIAVLDALGQTDDAQAFRLSCFEASLNADHLRAYLKCLPEFDDVDAEDRALSHALAFPSFNTALHFLLTWKALDHAAKLVVARADEIDGNYYELLTPVACTLESRHPLAATLLRRGLIDFALNEARSKRYRHAARHLAECASDADRITDYGSFEGHLAYVAALEANHGKKTSFWAEVRAV